MLPTFDPVFPEARTGRAEAVDEATFKASVVFTGKSSDWGGMTWESPLVNCIVSGALFKEENNEKLEIGSEMTPFAGGCQKVLRLVWLEVLNRHHSLPCDSLVVRADRKFLPNIASFSKVNCVRH